MIHRPDPPGLIERAPPRHTAVDAGRLRRLVLTVAILNLSYFFVEFAVALVAGSVSLFADSVDFSRTRR